MGSVKTFPGIVTAVVGRCEATLDQRDLDAGDPGRQCTRKPARPASDSPRKNAAPWNGRGSGTSSRCRSIPRCIEFCEEAVRETAGASHRMPSGPLHDAAEVARAGIPTVMMFVQSLEGISHNKIEDTKEEHLEMAVAALGQAWPTKTAAWIRQASEVSIGSWQRSSWNQER